MVLYSETTYPSRTRFLATSVFAKFETLQREEPKTKNDKLFLSSQITRRICLLFGLILKNGTNKQSVSTLPGSPVVYSSQNICYGYSAKIAGTAHSRH